MIQTRLYLPRMYRPRVFRQMLAVLLATIVVALVSVREVHYLFTEHGGQHEHCHNHLHAADAHFHCEVCKADIASFTDEVQPPAFVANQSYVSLLVLAPRAGRLLRAAACCFSARPSL
ncbi:MAG: hypothetical protein IPH78_12595 [Bacteroidetes bacterium]|nr:hypothetical protein [Bacteroidota bacterium]